MAWSAATHIGQTATSYAFGAVPTTRNPTVTLDSILPRVRALSPASFGRATSADSGIVQGIPKVRSWTNLLLGTQSGATSSLRGGIYRGENPTDNRIAHAEVTQASGNGGHTLDYLFNPDANASELHPEGSTKRQKDIPEALPAMPSKDQGETQLPQDPEFINIEGHLDMLLGCGYEHTDPTVHPIRAGLPNDTTIRSKVEQL